ncbi:MAG: hypothetical protein LC111_14760 [Bacteroidia bacterium]|nr:hypothetical protein [Bacteroidia bacterium]
MPLQAVNDWVKLTSTKYVYPDGYNGTFSQRSWCNFTWDPDAQQILFYEGYRGDHGQTAGSIYANAVYALTPADQTVRLLNLSNWTNPSYNEHVQGPGPEMPHPRHTYGGFLYVPSQQSVYLGFGACSKSSNCQKQDLWRYSVSSATWTKITAALPDGQIGGYNTVFGYLPGSEVLWAFSPRTDGSTWLNIYSFDLVASKWSAKVKYGKDVNGLEHVAPDPIGQRFLVATSAAPRLAYFDPKEGKLTPFASVPAGFPTDQVAMTYVSKHKVIFVYSAKSKKVGIMDPATGNYTDIVHPTDPGERMDRYLAYDEANDVVAMFNSQGEYWVFRYVP